MNHGWFQMKVVGFLNERTYEDERVQHGPVLKDLLITLKIDNPQEGSRFEETRGMKDAVDFLRNRD